MKKFKALVVGLIVLPFLLVPSPSYLQENPDKYEKAVASCDKLLAKARNRRYRSYWMRCITPLESLARENQGKPIAATIRLELAKRYQRMYHVSRVEKDLNQVLSAYRRLVEKYPDSQEAPEALFRWGKLLYTTQKGKGEGLGRFLLLFRQYPDSPWSTDAKIFLNQQGKEVNLPLSPERSKDGPAEVSQIRHWTNAGYTRVVVPLGREVSFSYRLLKSPSRLYLDLKSARLDPKAERQLPVSGGPLKKIRVAQHDKDTVRVVLDLVSLGTYQVFPLISPFRLVIDVTSEGARGQPKADKAGASLVQQLGLRVKKVVIDPGHGGKDPGAIMDGIQEKDVVLKAAKILRQALIDELGVQVLLTRETDVFVPLEERTAFANTQGADLFLSIHANASRNLGMRGLETYFLNLTSDECAIEVAARENAASSKNIGDLQDVLKELFLNAKITESRRLASAVHRGLSYQLSRRYSKVYDLGIKQAPFFVLIGAQMPSILIEMAFLTNFQDRQLLSEQAFLRSLAQGVLEGIQGYLKGANHSSVFPIKDAGYVDAFHQARSS
jgi:N-acetylmuramoyl-L-alanine amidase